MKNIKKLISLFGLTLCVIGSSVWADQDQKETFGPIMLTESQMDRVTAGAVFVVVEAFASADGLAGFTITNTSTRVIGGRAVELAFGTAEATACCGPEAVVAISLSGGGDGDVVKVFSRTRIVDTGEYKTARGRIIVLSYNLSAVGEFHDYLGHARLNDNRLREYAKEVGTSACVGRSTHARTTPLSPRL